MSVYMPGSAPQHSYVKHQRPPKMQWNLFIALVLPILGDGYEVWVWHHKASSMVTNALEGCTTSSYMAIRLLWTPLAVDWAHNFRQRICVATCTAVDDKLSCAIFDGTPIMTM